MKIKLLLISFILAANALGAVAQVSKTYFVSKPGTLISMMTEDEGIHSLMNPDTKQNADNAHSKKGVERNAWPCRKFFRLTRC